MKYHNAQEIITKSIPWSLFFWSHLFLFSFLRFMQLCILVLPLVTTSYTSKLASEKVEYIVYKKLSKSSNFKLIKSLFF